jgi:hypothetical protein
MKKSLKKISLKKTTLFLLGETASKMKNGGNADGQSLYTFTCTCGGLSECYCQPVNSKPYTGCRCQ